MMAFGVCAQALMKMSEMVPRPTGAKPTGLERVGAPVGDCFVACADRREAASERAESLVKARRSRGLMGNNVRLVPSERFSAEQRGTPFPLPLPQNIDSK